jgi:hypothetical protein
MTPTRRLDYAPNSALHRRVYHRAFRIVAVAGLIAAGYFWGPGIWKWTQFLYWQHQCLVFSKPPNHLVFDSDKSFFEPAAALTRFEKLGGSTRYGHNATIFLHEMRSPNGSAWLVSLSSCGTLPDDQIVVGTEARRPRGFIESAGNQYSYTECHFALPEHSKGLRVFAGQLDPVNPSHLTFEYEVNRCKQTMNAWLKDNGQLVLGPEPSM